MAFRFYKCVSLRLDGLYEAIISPPKRYLEDPKLAIIVPAFEIHQTKCVQFESCTQGFDLSYHMISRAIRRFPGTKLKLLQCIRSRRCSRFRPYDQLHDYFFAKWYSANYRELLTPVTCFKGFTQEPYVVVRKSPSLPSFDERFVNYAFNKVQWIEHLRYRGYQFSVMTYGFGVDMPHPQ